MEVVKFFTNNKKNIALTTFRGRILHHLISILLKSQSAKAYLCYRVFLSRSRGLFFFFLKKIAACIFKRALYSRAASIIHFVLIVLIVCYLQVITTMTFVFIYISFVFQSWKPNYQSHHTAVEYKAIRNNL